MNINFSNIVGTNEDNILNIYPYGSRIYGTNRPDSDYDFIIICKDGSVKDEFAIERENLNIHLYNLFSFKKLLDEHKISAMECIFVPKNKLLKYNECINFILNKQKLRSSISEKASHSWVKSKKKFDVEKDILIAKKSLFHSLRIINFGIQIATHGKIIDFSRCNGLWEEIYTNPSSDFSDYEIIYKKLFNNQMSIFRKLAPK